MTFVCCVKLTTHNNYVWRTYPDPIRITFDICLGYNREVDVCPGYERDEDKKHQEKINSGD